MVVSSLTHICVSRPQWVNRDLGHMFILTRHEFSGSMLQEGLPVTSSLDSNQGSLLLVLTETIVEHIWYVTWPANGVSKYNARHYLIANMYAMIYHSTAFVEHLTYMSLFLYKKKQTAKISTVTRKPYTHLDLMLLYLICISQWDNWGISRRTCASLRK